MIDINQSNRETATNSAVRSTETGEVLEHIPYRREIVEAKYKDRFMAMSTAYVMAEFHWLLRG